MICQVYQVGDDPGHLWLVVSRWDDYNDCEDGEVINGAWPLSYARKNNIPHTLVGEIDFDGDYNDSLFRFGNGERATLVKCGCCGNEEWEIK